jgi:hypothetical protein
VWWEDTGQQNKVIPVIQGTGNENTTFFQQDSSRPHTENVVLAALRDMFGSRVLSNRFQERFGCGWFWPPCSPDMNTCDYFLWGYLRDHVYHISPETVKEPQAGIEAGAEEITGAMMRDKDDTSLVRL